MSWQIISRTAHQSRKGKKNYQDSALYVRHAEARVNRLNGKQSTKSPIISKTISWARTTHSLNNISAPRKRNDTKEKKRGYHSPLTTLTNHHWQLTIWGRPRHVSHLSVLPRALAIIRTEKKEEQRRDFQKRLRHRRFSDNWMRFFFFFFFFFKKRSRRINSI